MTTPSNRTLVCSILFLDIVEYSKQTVSGQLDLKQQFNRLLGEALEQVAPDDRVILDTGDGAAVTFLGDPEDALFVAMAIRDGAGALPVRMGINLGPVRLVKDLNGQVNILGDGINVAQRIMSFSGPGQLLVSRSFYEVVSCLANDYASLFQHEGARTDKHVREHEVYSVAEGFDPHPGKTGFDKTSSRARPPVFDLSPDQSSATNEGTAQPAQIYDAGTHLVISGYSNPGVAEALKTLADGGSRVLSPPTRIGNKWMATCEKPGVSACKVEQMGYTRIVMGPTREAVSAKVEELQLGSALVGEIECTAGIWTAICDTSNSGN